MEEKQPLTLADSLRFESVVFWFVELKEIGDVIGYMAATASEASISLFPPQRDLASVFINTMPRWKCLSDSFAARGICITCILTINASDAE